MEEEPAAVSAKEQGPRPGDWVQVWARVSDYETHPEDLRVEVDSHNASPNAVIDVRRDWVTQPDHPPEFAQRCPALYLLSTASYIRCEKHDGHFAAHECASQLWTDEGTAGYIEEA